LTMCLFRMTVRISNYETPVPTNRATVSLIKVKQCNALLRMVPVCIDSYLKSVLRYKLLLLDICHPMRGSVVIFRNQRSPRAKELGETLLERTVTEEVAPLLFVFENAQECDNTTMCWPTLCLYVCIYVCNTKWEGERRPNTDIHDVIT